MQPCSQRPRLAAYIDFFLNYIMVALSRIWAKSHILKGWRLSKWSIFFSYLIVFYWQCLTISPEYVCVCIIACPHNFLKHKCVCLLYSSPCLLKYQAKMYYVQYATYVFFRLMILTAQQWLLTFAAAKVSRSIENCPIINQFLEKYYKWQTSQILIWSNKVFKNKDSILRKSFSIKSMLMNLWSKHL